MKRVKASDFPQLRRVFEGYLHEDFLQEHASAADAVRAFLSDANATERKQVAREARRFIDRTSDLDFADLVSLFHRLGARWTPESREALVRLLSQIAQSTEH